MPGDAEEASDELDDSGLVARAAVVRQELETRFGALSLGGFEPGGISTGHMEGSAHYEGRAIDIFVRPINAENKQRGWAMAAYLVANADRLDINTMIFDDRIWHAGLALGRRVDRLPRAVVVARRPGDPRAPRPRPRRRHRLIMRRTCDGPALRSEVAGTSAARAELSAARRATAASTRSSVAVNATRTCSRPAAP